MCRNCTTIQTIDMICYSESRLLFLNFIFFPFDYRFLWFWIGARNNMLSIGIKNRQLGLDSKIGYILYFIFWMKHYVILFIFKNLSTTIIKKYNHLIFIIIYFSYHLKRNCVWAKFIVRVKITGRGVGRGTLNRVKLPTVSLCFEKCSTYICIYIYTFCHLVHNKQL